MITNTAGRVVDSLDPVATWRLRVEVASLGLVLYFGCQHWGILRALGRKVALRKTEIQARRDILDASE